MKVRARDFIDLIQCYYRTRDSDDPIILGRSDAIVDRIKKYYEKKYKKEMNKRKTDFKKVDKYYQKWKELVIA